MHLRDEVAAEWGDVAHALLEVGLTPADMLRVVLPLLGEDDPRPAMRMALLEFPNGSGEEEAWEVMDYFFPGMTEDELMERATNPTL